MKTRQESKKQRWIKLLERVAKGGDFPIEGSIEEWYSSLTADARGYSAIVARDILEQLIESAITEALRRKGMQIVITVQFITPEGPIAVMAMEKNTGICLTGNEYLSSSYLVASLEIDRLIESLEDLVKTMAANFEERIRRAVEYAQKRRR